MRALWELGDLVRAMRREMRFGELSRAPLRLLSLEWHSDSVRCEWMARPADVWDADVSLSIRERKMTEQALKDAIAIRDLLFSVLPGITSANLRVYRQGDPPELVIAGSVTRDSPALSGIRSLAMRVKLCGLHFHLENGKLEPLLREGPT
jgi:hypothetical protein